MSMLFCFVSESGPGVVLFSSDPVESLYRRPQTSAVDAQRGGAVCVAARSLWAQSQSGCYVTELRASADQSAAPPRVPRTSLLQCLPPGGRGAGTSCGDAGPTAGDEMKLLAWRRSHPWENNLVPIKDNFKFWTQTAGTRRACL